MDEKDGINKETSLPHELSLARVLDEIRLAPHEISSLLAHWAQAFSGGPQAGMTTKLQKAAAMVVNPNTYSGKEQAPLDSDARLDTSGREVTPRVQTEPDQAPSPQHLNPGMPWL